jgi:hypothetical protein
MSKSSGFAPTPQAMSRPGSPGPGLGYDKNEDRQALMMGPLGEGRRGADKVDKDTLAQAQPGAKDQGGY